VNDHTELAGTVREINFESGGGRKPKVIFGELDTSSEEAQLRSLEAQVQWAKSASTVKPLLEPIKSVHSRILIRPMPRGNICRPMPMAPGPFMKRKPFAPRLQVSSASPGQSWPIPRRWKTIVSLQSLTPVYTDFSLPQQELDISNLA